MLIVALHTCDTLRASNRPLTHKRYVHVFQVTLQVMHATNADLKRSQHTESPMGDSTHVACLECNDENKCSKTFGQRHDARPSGTTTSRAEPESQHPCTLLVAWRSAVQQRARKRETASARVNGRPT